MPIIGIEGFKQQFVAVDRAKIAVHVGGNGAPVLMLHGFSQNHMASEKVASALSAMGPYTSMVKHVARVDNMPSDPIATP